MKWKQMRFECFNSFGSFIMFLLLLTIMKIGSSSYPESSGKWPQMTFNDPCCINWPTQPAVSIMLRILITRPPDVHLNMTHSWSFMISVFIPSIRSRDLRIVWPSMTSRNRDIPFIEISLKLLDLTRDLINGRRIFLLMKNPKIFQFHKTLSSLVPRTKRIFGT